MSMFDLKGKRVLITGGAGGIGFAAAKMFAEAGAHVVTTDLVSSVEDKRMRHIIGDAAEEDSANSIVSKACSLLNGRIDILVNNCGVGANLDHQEGRAIVCQTAVDFDNQDFDRVMAINFKSAVWFVKHVIPHMPKDDGSVIISASSIWSRGKLHYALPYAASKGALSVAAMNWAYQFAPIRSVGIVIGGIDTPMLRTNPNGAKEVAEQTLLKRAGNPEEIAKAYLFAAACRYLTATEIVVDGGSFNR